MDAKKQIDETQEFILPMAMKYGLGPRLLIEIEKFEQRASKIALRFLERKVSRAAKI